MADGSTNNAAPTPRSVDLSSISFLWWNVESFSHYDASKKVLDRWPKSKSAYEGKCQRLDQAFRTLFAASGTPDVVGLAEITRAAAEEIRERILPGYKVLSMDLHDDDPSFHVAFLYRDTPQFVKSPPIIVPYMPRQTRPMAVLDFHQGEHHIRFVAAHWTAPFEAESRINQEKIANYLEPRLYEFLHEDSQQQRHVILMGDFNTEPFDLMDSHFHSTRSRGRATSRHHYTDGDIGRIRLYNCSWRLLGERSAHVAGSGIVSVAGTYYSRDRKTWHTFDQILVSGSLLTHNGPNLCEDKVVLLGDHTLLSDDGLPEKFSWNRGAAKGLSDHLPIAGSINLV